MDQGGRRFPPEVPDAVDSLKHRSRLPSLPPATPPARQSVLNRSRLLDRSHPLTNHTSDIIWTQVPTRRPPLPVRGRLSTQPEAHAPGERTPPDPSQNDQAPLHCGRATWATSAPSATTRPPPAAGAWCPQTPPHDALVLRTAIEDSHVAPTDRIESGHPPYHKRVLQELKESVKGHTTTTREGRQAYREAMKGGLNRMRDAINRNPSIINGPRR